MVIAIGSDHGGYDLKEQIKNYLMNKGYEIIDCGTTSKDSCDYPIFGHEVGLSVANKKASFGVVVCTTGEGISISANKVKGVRCGLAFNDDAAKFIRLHNDCNVIAFGAKYTTINEAYRRLDIFLNTEFEGGRHQRRVDQIENF